jgi:hypothetical protein
MPVVLTLPLLERMRRVEGWLSDAEADLLVAAAVRALSSCPAPRTIVEAGCYCGKATTVLGGVARTVDPEARVVAIDPHDGVVGALDDTIRRTRPTLARFRATIADAGLGDRVETVAQAPHAVAWDRPIALLVVDGLHDYASVSRDFLHFEPWLAPTGLVAFHDDADYFPGVQALVAELLHGGGFGLAGRAESLTVLHRARDAA